MKLFNVKKPRPFSHTPIYIDERKEKLTKMEESAKRELGLLPDKEFNPEDIRGKLVESTTHLKRRKQSGRKPLSLGIALAIIALLLYIWHYLLTGRFDF